MHIDPAQHSHADNYKLLTNVVIPRPIAWVSSVSRTGIVNLAPFSFFNAVGSKPLYLVVSIGRRDDGTLKDSARNIEDCGEFVVNLVAETMLAAMNISAADFPADESELSAAKLNPSPSLRIRAPRLAEAPVSLECKLFQSLTLGTNTLYVGEVVMFHVDDRLVGPRLHIKDFAPVGRLGSPSMYCRTADRFELPRISHAQWQASRK